ncbi:MAG: hypothetical protein PHW52_03750, partial [Candidatus Pacebacteria bacterium]|nr:hypothetical protein [Candidatus Paceibacterota bacterium]
AKNTTYCYSIWSYNPSTAALSTSHISGCGTLSNMASPTNLTFPTVAYNSIILNWTPGTGSTKTYIVRKQGSIPANKDDGTNVYNDNGNAFIDTGLTNNVQYCYALYATNDTEYTEPTTGCTTTILNAAVFNETTEGNYIIDKYTLIAGATSSASINWTVPAGVTQVDYLVVAGGGGGDTGGGGGAGGLLYSEGYSVTPNSPYAILVGVGGVAGKHNGSNSSFGSLTAIGGGGGGKLTNDGNGSGNGLSGGSGGGGGYVGNSTGGPGGVGTAGPPRQGYGGGAGYSYNAGGGGGGYGSAGITATSTNGGNGGAGITIWGTGYAGGGGGRGGVGGAATHGGGASGAAGSAGTGGGGGASNIGGSGGGSGIVIIKYFNPLAVVNGACGGAAKTYLASDTSFTGSMCLGNGSITPSSFNFPERGASVSWVCGGQNGGTSSVTCTASRSAYEDNDPSLLLAWHFSEGSGSSVVDSSGKGNTGTITGATWTTTAGKNCLSFSGTDNYVKRSSLLGASKTEGTYSIWIKPSAISANKGFLSIGSASWGDGNYTVISQNNTDIRVGVWTGSYQSGSYQYTTASSVLVLNNWTHVVFVNSVSNSLNKLYIDGVLVGSGSTYQDSSTNHSYLEVGKNSAGNDSFSGLIDEPRIYSRALSQTEITNLYNVGKLAHP